MMQKFQRQVFVNEMGGMLSIEQDVMGVTFLRLSDPGIQTILSFHFVNKAELAEFIEYLKTV